MTARHDPEHLVRLHPAPWPITPPVWEVPAGAWDTHAHVFEDTARYPLAADATYLPQRESGDMYLKVLDELGITSGVLIQPSVYGYDNACLLDALDEAGGRLLGVVTVDLDAMSEHTLAEFADRGVCGIRIAWTPELGEDVLKRWAERLDALGWHLDIRVSDDTAMAKLAPVLGRLSVPIMVESMGSPAPNRGTDAPGFQSLLRLLAEDRIYVKISHAYQIDKAGPPYAEAAQFARSILDVAPNRAVWGSDWPHPLPPDATVPDTGSLLDALQRWGASSSEIKHVLVDNPERFYTGEPSRSTYPRI